MTIPDLDTIKGALALLTFLGGLLGIHVGADAWKKKAAELEKKVIGYAEQAWRNVIRKVSSQVVAGKPTALWLVELKKIAADNGIDLEAIPDAVLQKAVGYGQHWLDDYLLKHGDKVIGDAFGNLEGVRDELAEMLERLRPKMKKAATSR